ncbi:MAG: PEGA domain-containing protein [Microgenomates group bacterium]
MKQKLVVLLTLVIVFVIFILIRFFILDRQNNYGVIKITSSPTTSVFIDNVIVGKTPYNNKIKAGEHLIKLIPEGVATETASWNGKVNVFKNSLTYVNRELGSSDILTAGEIITTEQMKTSNKNFGEIYVETDPQGAIVSLDNDEKGVAPLILQDVTDGIHELSVFMPGFFRRTQKIRVYANYRINAVFKLALDQSQKQLTDLEKQKTASESAQPTKTMIIINNNPQGWLRVRADASINATEEAKVKVGEKFEFLGEKDGWYKIKFNGNPDALISGDFSEGWVSKEYVTKE